MLRRVALMGLVLFLVGCGGSGKRSATGSVPVKTIAVPSRTVTYSSAASAMEPTIHCARPGTGCQGTANDGLVTKEPATGLQRADIVVFRTPPLAAVKCGAGGKFVKRIIGLPGDVWEERNGYVYIDGKKLDEPYVQAERRDAQTLTLADIPPLRTMKQIPQDMYLVMGDNRSSSCDSRVWGLVPRANIIGKVVQILRQSNG
ncbi:MAG TPA: signal peptidase I [Gemmatimonadales bacterium]|nr:signal peptidase I [Gemmatimonadales bacterium]